LPHPGSQEFFLNAIAAGEAHEAIHLVGCVARNDAKLAEAIERLLAAR
jgi:hypothetical protein